MKPIQFLEKIQQNQDQQTEEHGLKVHDKRPARVCTMAWNGDVCIA